MAWLSIKGLYDYEPTMFDQLELPTQIDPTSADVVDATAKDALITLLVAETAELEVIYPDADIMKTMIGAWSHSRLHTWQRMADVLYENYEPFVNIKRDETRTITTSGSNTEQVSAWDSSDFTNRGKNTGTSLVTENFHVEGDSAITDAQDVLRKEIKARQDYDLLKIIKNEFIQRFCLMVYCVPLARLMLPESPTLS